MNKPKNRRARGDRDPVSLTRRKLLEWLREGSWGTKPLLGWLQGHDLPAMGHEQEPYQWLLMALPAGPERRRVNKAFAVRIARLLDQRPDVRCRIRSRSDVLYGLYLLSAGMDSPDELSRPLRRVYGRLAAGRCKLNAETRDGLLSALITNQVDSSMENTWWEMIETRRHRLLPGNEYAGFSGILRMPASTDRRGRPNVVALGKALLWMARHLRSLADRRKQFGLLVQQVLEVYPGEPYLPYELTLQAHSNRWPMWAVDSLPWTVAPSKAGDGALAWLFAGACIPPEYDFKIVRTLCRGRILQLSLSRKARNLLDFLADVFAGHKSAKHSTDRALVGILAAALEEAELSRDQLDAEARRSLGSAHRRLLESAGLVPAVEAIGQEMLRIAKLNPSSADDRMKLVFGASAAIMGKTRILAAAKQHVSEKAYQLMKKVA